MTRLDDDILFADEEGIFAAEDSAQDPAPRPAAEGWKLLIADDDEEVHSLTRLVLSGFSFEGRGLDFLSAHSGRETVEMLREHPDTALVLLDVVMESDDAGLKAVRKIRRKLKNSFVRIILRTGQPGQAPEQEVISNYDINDYKAKTELTSQKLFTTVTSALRAYRDLRTIESHRVGLEKVNEASRHLFEIHDPDEFTEEILTRAASLMSFDEGEANGVVTQRQEEKSEILAGIGAYDGRSGKAASDVLTDTDMEIMQDVLSRHEERVLDDGYACFLQSRCGAEGLVLVRGDRALTDLQRDLLRAYASNVRVAYDNIHLNREVLDTQREVIHTLGEVVESRSQETANHVKRVGRNSYLLAKLVGMSEDEALLLQMAAPLHDVGKIGIPDAILNKPGKLTDEEREVMKTHSEIGYNILANSTRPVFQAASIVACEHHERWDGGGYPRGLVGEAIHIFGRIVGLMDVFDALRSERVYKAAMPLEKCVEIIREERGCHFDPRLVDLFLEHLDVFTGEESAAVTAEETERVAQPV